MAVVYCKFESANDYFSVPMDGCFISLRDLKQRIFEAKQLGIDNDYDIILSNAQNNEEYDNESVMIPKNTSILVRRVPGPPQLPIIAEQKEAAFGRRGWLEHKTPPQEYICHRCKVPGHFIQHCPTKGDPNYDIKRPIPSTSILKSMLEETPDGSYAIPSAAVSVLKPNEAIFERHGWLERKTPPRGYICHRCKVPGHYFQHCPINGDPNYDIKRPKPPTGILKSMLEETPDGSYAIASGAVAVLKPNEAAFERHGWLEHKTPPQGYICHRCKVPGHFIQHCPTKGDPNYDIERSIPPTSILKSMLEETPNGSYAIPSGAVAILKPNEAAFERRGWLEHKTPPQGYICHRCKVPGHFIQHCPTKGDPNYDIKRPVPPTSILKSMKEETPYGSYDITSGAAAVLKPNEAAFERRGWLEHRTLPQEYICHRCKVPGHFIQHCPTKGDPNYDIKRPIPPTSILKSMLEETPDGSYAIPSAAVSVLEPNDNLLPELHCRLCKEVMKDAALTSKCCLRSFCYNCIRDHIISNLMCECGGHKHPS